MKAVVITVMAATALAIVGTLWFVIIVVSNKINNDALEYCYRTSVATLQDQGVYSDCLRRMR